mgnify:CR=1 FL=1
MWSFHRFCLINHINFESFDAFNTHSIYGIENFVDSKVNYTSDKIYFHGIGGTEKKKHEVTIPLFKEIDSEVYYFVVIPKYSHIYELNIE